MRRTSGDGSFLRSLNEVAVLRALRETGTPTLAEVARAAQLSRATTEVIMDALQRNGWVVEAEAVAGGQRGRPARRYTFRAAAAHVAGVAIGGSGITAMVADLDGDVVGRAAEHLSPELSAAERLDAVQRVLEHAAGTRRRAAEPAGHGRRRHHRRHRQRGPGAQERGVGRTGRGWTCRPSWPRGCRSRCWSRTTCGWRCWPSTGAARRPSTRTCSTCTPAAGSAWACCSAGCPTGARTPPPASSAGTRTAGGRRSSTSWTTRWPPTRASCGRRRRPRCSRWSARPTATTRPPPPSRPSPGGWPRDWSAW